VRFVLATVNGAGDIVSSAVLFAAGAVLVLRCGREA
jgi:hypothetical protein